MTIVAIVMAFLIAVTVHEAAHWLAMRNRGIRISHAGLGLRFRPYLSLPPRGRRTFALTLSPWLVAAYVQPDERDEEKFDSLPYRAKAWCWNAGIVANFMLTAASLAVMSIAHGHWLPAVTWLSVLALLWWGRIVVATVLVPLACIPALAFSAWAFVESMQKHPTEMGYVGLESTVSSASVSPMILLATMSLALAIFNSIPFYGLDNGRVIDCILGRFMSETMLSWSRALGLSLLITVSIICVGSDVVNIASR